IARNDRSLYCPDLIDLAIATGAQVFHFSTHAGVKLGIGLQKDETAESVVYAVTQPIQAHGADDDPTWARVKRCMRQTGRVIGRWWSRCPGSAPRLLAWAREPQPAHRDHSPPGAGPGVHHDVPSSDQRFDQLAGEAVRQVLRPRSTPRSRSRGRRGSTPRSRRP